MRFRISIIPIMTPLFLSMILQPVGVVAQDKKVYTLEESIREALSKNRTFKAKEEEVTQATYVKKQVRAKFLPKLSTSYNYSRLSEPTTFWGIPINVKDNYQWKGTITQPVFTGFELTSSYRLAELGIDQSKLDLEQSKLDLVLKVKKAYFQILIADKAVEVNRKDVESRKSNVKVARNFFKVGMIPINDVLKAEVELANTQQNLITARNAAKFTRSAFNTVLSRPVNAPVDIVDILIYKPEHGDFQGYIEEAFKNRPEMKLLDINILQAEQKIRLAKSENYPEISLQYDYVKEGDSPGVSGGEYHDSNSWEITAVCTWTLWEWGKTHYTVKEKESLKNQLEQTKLALEDSIRLEVKEEVLALKNAEDNIPTTRKAVEQAEENLRVNDERYKAQVTTITEVLDAQSLLTQAIANYYRALYNHNLAKARLQRTIGAY